MFELLSFMFFNSVPVTVVSLLFVATCVLFTEYEKDGLGVVSFIVYLFLIWFLSGMNPFLYMWENKLFVLYFIAGYFTIGTIYSCIKYNSWLTDRLNQIAVLRKDFLRLVVDIKIKEDTEEEWTKYVRNEKGYKDTTALYFKENLKPSENKGRFLGWIAYWPFSAMGLFLTKPLERLVNYLYDNIVGFCNKIYERKVKSILKD